jgi:signal peptidase II
VNLGGVPRRWRWFVALAALVALADQLTKLWARTLPTDSLGRGVAVPVIEGFWDWRLSYNLGASFGILHGVSGARIFLTAIGLVALGAILWMVKQARDDQTKTLWGLGLVFGGAVGNLVDRIAFGKVTDFVVWKYHSHEWPTFNVADVALCVGVGLLLLDMRGQKPAAAPADAAAPVPRRRGKGGKRRR